MATVYANALKAAEILIDLRLREQERHVEL